MSSFEIFIVQFPVEATPPAELAKDHPSVIAGFQLMADASMFRNNIARKYRQRSMRPVKVQFCIYSDWKKDGVLHYRKLA